MHQSLLRRAAFCGLLLISTPMLALAQDAIVPASPAQATVAQLGWIAGRWVGTLGERTIEQHWMTPLGTSMVAMFRNVQGDKPMLYELLVLEQEGTGVVLRIKHFAPGAGLVGRQEKDQSVDHPLVRVDGQTAVFQGGLPGAAPARITFHKADADHLTITVARERDGKVVGTDFNYRRVTP